MRVRMLERIFASAELVCRCLFFKMIGKRMVLWSFVFQIGLSFVVLGETSETRRGTFDGIEWLYTIDIETRRLVLEKAILLTSEEYDMNVNISGIVLAVLGDMGVYDASGDWDVWFGASAFEGNEYLRSLTIFSGSTGWGLNDDSCINLAVCENAFKGCTNLSSFGGDGNRYGANIRLISIGDSAFKDAGSSRITFKTGPGFEMAITNIGERAFYYSDRHPLASGLELDIERLNSESMENAFFSDMLKWIGSEAFAGIDFWGTNNRIIWPKSLSTIQNSVFMGAKLDIAFQVGITNISENAFSNCTFLNMTNSISWYDSYALELPDGLVEVGTGAFSGAMGYKTLKLPDSLKRIGDSAFSGYKERLGGPNMTNPLYPWRPYDFRSVLSGEFTIPGSVESIGGFAFSNHPYLKKVVISEGVKSISSGMFLQCLGLEEVVIPNTVTEIGSRAFEDCTNLTVKIPSSVIKFNNGPRGIYGMPKCIIFEGDPPQGIGSLMFLAKEVWVPIDNQVKWTPYLAEANVKLAKQVDGKWVKSGGEIISSEIRTNDPTIMDIIYKVTSVKDKVNVRLLAFQDGTRSFASVLRPETFVDGTATNIGDNVAANIEHKVSWHVSEDWGIDLAKVSVDVYVMEDKLLPLHLTTIPSTGDHVSVTFSRNVQNEEKVMNALFWLYADGTPGLTLANGVLSNNGTQLVNGSTLSAANAVSYLYSKMGYGTLSEPILSYVNSILRLSLSPKGIEQYAVKEGEE